MKTSTIAPAVIACLMSIVLTNAGPIPSSYELSARDDSGVDALYVRDIEAEIFARASELASRGQGSSKPKKDSKASYPVGNNKPETPTGEFRKFTAGRDDDYFGDWQTMTGGKGKSGVDNPAAGKGKKTGKRDLFDEYLEARGQGSSKPKKDSKASYPVGNNKPETPTGEFRKFTAGRDDDYFGDWQTMTGGKGKSGVDNPAAGKGKKTGKRDLFDEEYLEARGQGSSKPKKDSKASYPVGNNKPETPTGEFRKFTAGRDDDYFGDWQTMTGGKGKSGVDNPAAGKGKKTGKRDLLDEYLEARGQGFSKPKKDTKASYPVGNNKPETPTGEFRKFTAGRDDDYFGDWQTMTGGKGKSGVDNPAAGKGKKTGKRDLFDEYLEARGHSHSKEKKKDSKASYPVGDNKPETPTGEFRKFTAGRDDDYFGDWQTMTGGKGKSGVDNPAAGKGKKTGKRDLFDDEYLEARGQGFSKPKKDTKASYPVGNNKPETPTGEFRKFTAGRDDDYFGDWQTMTGGKGKSGVDNPAAGKGKKTGKRDLFDDEFLEARGHSHSKEKKKDSKASYPVGDNKPETPTGEFRKFTAGRDDDYFGDWQTMTGGKGKSGVDNPAAGKGKKTGKRDLFDDEYLEARGQGSSKPKKDSKASYPVGNNKPETPTGEFRKFTAGRDDDYFGDWQTMTGGKGKSGVDNPAAGKGKKTGKRDLFEEYDLD